MLNYFHKI